MLSIRPVQMTAFENASRARFEKDLAAQITRIFTEAGANAPSAGWVADQIRRGLSEAPACGFASSRHVAEFIQAVCTLQGGFPEGPLPRPALAILRTYGMAPDVKLQRYRAWAGATSAGVMPFNDVPVASVVVPCRKEQPTPEHWIEIELVGEDDLPIPWEEYEVVLPDGTPASGYLDADGFARLEGIRQAATCQVRFPNLDRDAWEKVATLPERARS